MDIIKRNFLRALRSGAFAEIEQFEPMSTFKWNKMLRIVISHNVSSVAIKGFYNANYENVPYDTIHSFFNSYGIDTNDTISEKISIPQCEMSNGLLNKKLRKIRYSELHAIDTSIETLDLLNIIVYNTNKILTYGITYDNLLLLGKYLRNKGDKVDFVKLDSWLQQLKLQEMAQFEGSILVTTLNFEIKEIPFVHNIEPIASKRAITALNHVINLSQTKGRLFRQGKSGLLHNNSALLRDNIWHCAKYISYAPLETTSNLMNRLANSLSEIEE